MKGSPMKNLPEDPAARQPMMLIAGGRVRVQGSFRKWLGCLWPFIVLFAGVAICGQIY